ncbi:MAG: aspartate aminotransferase family protein [Desulfobacterales bacterium]|nr:MAG: aspartate aminotransferase family protein [Desulfobacterales bacterium]
MSDIQKRSDAVFIGNYSRYPVTLVSGKGCVVTDEDGRQYLDFLAGIAVCSLGHCHPDVSEAIQKQASELVHVSNLYYTTPQLELAERLVANSFADKVFFCNSGAEANEGAIKLARIHSAPGKYQIISLEGSFHGRTLAALAATGQPRFHQGFEPIPEGFVHAPFGDLAALETMISESTCAILCEPIQGESGVRPLDTEYLKGLRKLCDRHGLLLIFDEVQTGIGRSGRLFAYEHSGVIPDIMTLAKALANGLPMGAMLTTDAVAKSLLPGTHATTFGGNPVVAAAAVAVLDSMLAPGFLDGVALRGQYLQDQLAGLVPLYPELLEGVRGTGMLQALVLTEKGKTQGTEIVRAMLESGVLINFAGNAALRFAPPLIATEAEMDTVVEKLKVVLAGVS